MRRARTLLNSRRGCPACRPCHHRGIARWLQWTAHRRCCLWSTSPCGHMAWLGGWYNRGHFDPLWRRTCRHRGLSGMHRLCCRRPNMAALSHDMACTHGLSCGPRQLSLPAEFNGDKQLLWRLRLRLRLRMWLRMLVRSLNLGRRLTIGLTIWLRRCAASRGITGTCDALGVSGPSIPVATPAGASRHTQSRSARRGGRSLAHRCCCGSCGRLGFRRFQFTRPLG